MTLMNCDPATGSCRIPDAAPILPRGEAGPWRRSHAQVHRRPHVLLVLGYFLHARRTRTVLRTEGYRLHPHHGRPARGRGRRMGPEFREFLRREWTHIAKVTGQPFGFSLLSAKHFDYDTEPACRAVVVAEQMLDQKRPVASATLAFSLPCSASSMSKARTPRTWTFIDPFAKTLRYRSKTSARISPLPLHGKPSIGNSPSVESGAYAHSPPFCLTWLVI